MNIVRNFQMFAAACLLSVVAACSSSPTIEDYAARAQMPNNPQNTAPVQQPQSQAPTANPTPTATAPTAGQYLLGNGDRLRITVFGEPDLSGEFVVDGAGQISMPLIGEITASGMSIRDLQRMLETQYREGYLNNPRISAEILNYRPYYILGEVNRPGEYPFMSGLTVLNAVATAQGFTYRANKSSVYIRGVNDREERKVKLSSSLTVHPGDTIRISERLF